MRRIHPLFPVLLAVGLFLLLSHLASAGDAAPAAPAAAAPPPKGFDKVWYFLATSSFAAGLIFLFAAAIVTAYVARLIRDRCLKTFRGYPVTIEMKDGSVRTGSMDVERTGMELLYMPAVPQDLATPHEASYLLFHSEYPKIYLLIRYLDCLTDNEKQTRLAHGILVFEQKFFRRLKRKIRNAFAALKDAFVEALTMVIGRMKGGQGTGATVIGAQQRYVSQAGGVAIGYVAENSFDPLLEKQIRRKMIVEVAKSPAEILRFEGVFVEYSADFIQFKDVVYRSQWSVDAPCDGGEFRKQNVTFTRSGATVKIANPNPYELALKIIPAPTDSDQPPPSSPPGAAAKPPVEMTIPPGSTTEIPLESAAANAKLSFSSARMADIIVPRAIGLVRSKAEQP